MITPLANKYLESIRTIDTTGRAAVAAFRLGAEMVNADINALLAKDPGYVSGERPFDGPTAGIDGFCESAEPINNWAGYYLGSTTDVGGDDDQLV